MLLSLLMVCAASAEKTVSTQPSPLPSTGASKVEGLVGVRVSLAHSYGYSFARSPARHTKNALSDGFSQPLGPADAHDDPERRDARHHSAENGVPLGWEEERPRGRSSSTAQSATTASVVARYTRYGICETGDTTRLPVPALPPGWPQPRATRSSRRRSGTPRWLRPDREVRVDRQARRILTGS